MLGIERGRAPCHATYHYVFRAIAAADLERALGTLWWPAMGRSGMWRSTASGSFSTRLQAAVGSLGVAPDSAEAVEPLKLLKTLPLEGVIVTGDAAFTYRRIIEAILAEGGQYFLFVKANQPVLP